MTHPAIASPMEPRSMEATAMQAAMKQAAAAMQAATAMQATAAMQAAKQVTLHRAIQARSTRMGQVRPIVGPTTLPTHAAGTASNRRIASIAGTMISTAMPAMYANASSRANDGQG